jgi:hypothetical protein
MNEMIRGSPRFSGREHPNGKGHLEA